ncbi:hypothetical protein ACF1BE_29775 [Streptomyces sp. NPDC014991]|uniref:hypothetical protein n=1 Tax=Streptomyces sp. NPDC014991 TaxID=3364935 RepID=UPI0036F7FEDB
MAQRHPFVRAGRIAQGRMTLPKEQGEEGAHVLISALRLGFVHLPRVGDVLLEVLDGHRADCGSEQG